jgi:Ca-activated chloride channel family protein
VRRGGAFGAAAVAAAMLLAACRPSPRAADLTLLAAPENAPFEPLVRRFCDLHHLACVVRYQASADIALALRDARSLDADVVWPAAALWLDVFDGARRVQDVQSIYQTPVVLGVRLSKARELGWVGRPVSMAEIRAAVVEGRLRLLAGSAIRSNAGALAYLAMLQATPPADDGVLGRTVRVRGSDAQVAAVLTQADGDAAPFDAMWNQEALIRETNATLRGQGLDPLYAVYPTEGAPTADAPMAFVSRGQEAQTRQRVRELETYLTSGDAQAEFARQGRRIALGAAPLAPADAAWNFDPSRSIPPAQLPAAASIAGALDRYQAAARPAAVTAICVDESGPMAGAALAQSQAGLRRLLDPDAMRTAFASWSPRDHIILIPFQTQVSATFEATGAPGDLRGLAAHIAGREPGGDADVYGCAQRALELTHDRAARGARAAVLLLTSGRSIDGLTQFMDRWRSDGRRVPVILATFGDVDTEQTAELARQTGGGVYDGRRDLLQALRVARGDG